MNKRGTIAAEKDPDLHHVWPQELVQLTEVAEACLVSSGKSETEAQQLARAVVMAIAESRGGRQLYLPCGSRLRKAIRDAEIYRRANSNNIQQLAAEHKLTTTQIYAIITRQRQLHKPNAASV